MSKLLVVFIRRSKKAIFEIFEFHAISGRCNEPPGEDWHGLFGFLGTPAPEKPLRARTVVSRSLRGFHGFLDHPADGVVQVTGALKAHGLHQGTVSCTASGLARNDIECNKN